MKYKFTGKHDSYYNCNGRLLVGITRGRISGIWYSVVKRSDKGGQWTDVWCDKKRHGVNGNVTWYYYD